METIEERAYRKSLKMLNPNFLAVPTTRELLVEMATEQREIDIDKACHWLEVNYGHFDGTVEDLVSDFRKAMEE